MHLRYFMFCLTLFVFYSCKSDHKRIEIQQSSTQGPVAFSEIDKVDTDFNTFIELFSQDTAFQRKRTKFPLRIKQYDIENDKDTIIYNWHSGFEVMDFRRKKSDSRYDQWEQQIVVDKNQTKATIEIRGIENGIMVDYYFEKKDGRWMLVSIDDSST